MESLATTPRTPAASSSSISATSACGETTTPLPMKQSTSARRMPDGIRCSTVFLPPITSVWPALWPPWKRTTAPMSLVRRSTILPLPSSPHCAPRMTTDLPMGPCPCVLSADDLQHDEPDDDHAGPDHTQRPLIDLLQLFGDALPEAGRCEQEQPLDHEHEAERGAKRRHASLAFRKVTQELRFRIEHEHAVRGR